LKRPDLRPVQGEIIVTETITITLPCRSPEIAQDVVKHYIQLTQHSSGQEPKPVSLDTPPSAKAARAPRPQLSTTATNDQQLPAIADKSALPSLELVRARLAAISQAGKTDQVKQLLQRFGADRLTALDPKHFAELMAAAENL
jgi:hypothetical protein